MFGNQEEMMKWNKLVAFTAVASIAVITVQAAPVIEKPAVMPEAMLSVTVSDLHGFIDGVGEIAGQSNPMMNGDMIKNMVGMQLGDPGLAGIAPGKGLAIVALDKTNMFAVVEVAEAQSAAYAGMATSQGMQAKYANGLLILGSTPALVEKGVAMSGKVQAKLLAKRTPTLRLAAQPSAIMERNKEVVDGFMESMQGMMSMGMQQAPGATTNSVEGTMAILEAELRVLSSLAAQCEVGELVLAPKDGGLQISKTVVPKAGTALSKLVNAPKNGKADPKIQAGILGDGDMLMMDFVVGNTEALTDFMAAEVENLMGVMDFKDANPAKWVDLMKKWTVLYAGAGAETFDFDAEEGMSVNYLMAVSDEAKALNLFKTMGQDMAPLLKMYDAMGMPMTMAFKENVREYKGIKIHQFDMSFQMEDMPAEQKKQMEAMKLDEMTYELAIFDGKVIYAMGATKIETLIDRVKDPATVTNPVKARSVYPADGCFYLDFDVGRYVEFIASFMPAEAQGGMQPQMVAMLQGADPITSAGFRQDGRLMWSINIPGDLIGKLSQIGMMMQMQQMQQQQGMPGGMPQTMPVQ